MKVMSYKGISRAQAKPRARDCELTAPRAWLKRYRCISPGRLASGGTPLPAQPSWGGDAVSHRRRRRKGRDQPASPARARACSTRARAPACTLAHDCASVHLTRRRAPRASPCAVDAQCASHARTTLGLRALSRSGHSDAWSWNPGVRFSCTHAAYSARSGT